MANETSQVIVNSVNRSVEKHVTTCSVDHEVFERLVEMIFQEVVVETEEYEALTLGALNATLNQMIEFKVEEKIKANRAEETFEAKMDRIIGINR